MYDWAHNVVMATTTDSFNRDWTYSWRTGLQVTTSQDGLQLATYSLTVLQPDLGFLS